MPQPKLEYISIALSDDIGDSVTSLSANGEDYSAAQRLEAINAGRSIVFSTKLALYKDDMVSFVTHYSEFLETVNLSVTSGAVAKEGKYRMVISMGSSTGKIITRLTPDKYYDAIHNPESNYAPTEDDPKYFETLTSIKILGTTISGEETVDINFLTDPVDATIGGADIIEPLSWRWEIIEAAYTHIKNKKLLR